MKRFFAVAAISSVSLTTHVLTGDGVLADKPRTQAYETSKVSTLSNASENKAAAPKPKKTRWTNGTITKWDEASKTFVLKEETGGKKKTFNEVTYSWNEKTMVEGVESKVGEHAKVKYTRGKDGKNVAHHVFIGKKAIEEHKDEAADKN